MSVSSSSHGGHTGRQRLRPWLIDQINTGKYIGLEWIDKDRGMFRIPWRHYGRQGYHSWTKQEGEIPRDGGCPYGLIFKNWAIHTKKYKESHPHDMSQWKTNLRCALHKHPAILEHRNLNGEGSNGEPYRVYQFTPEHLTTERSTSNHSYKTRQIEEDGNVKSLADMTKMFTGEAQAPLPSPSSSLSLLLVGARCACLALA